LNPRAALQRRNEVLQAMSQQGYIPQAQYDRASRQDLGLDRGYKYETIREPYFFDFVQQQLIDKYGVNTDRNGGLKVYTTINSPLTHAVTLSLAHATTRPIPNADPGGGVMSVSDATTHSVNDHCAQLDPDVGPDQVRQTAYDMGITTHLDGIPAEGIGGLRLG